MTDLPGADGLHRDENAALLDDADLPCPYCGAARDPTKRSSGVCSECGQWDPDDDANRPRLLEWIERTRRNAGRGQSDDPTGDQVVEKDDARR